MGLDSAPRKVKAAAPAFGIKLTPTFNFILIMRLLHVMPHLPGGSEVWLDRMIRLLRDETVALVVEGAADDRYSSLPVERLYPRQPLWWRLLNRLGIRCRRPKAILPGMHDNLRRVVEKYQADTVLVHYLNFAVELLPALESIGCRQIYHLHGYDATWDFREYSSPETLKFPADYPERVRRLSQCGTILANSSFMEQRVLHLGVSKDRVAVKYFGVERYPEPTAKRKNQLLYIGRLVEFKGPGLVIKMFERACELGFAGELRMLGDGYLMEECRQLRERSEVAHRIHLEGMASPESCSAAFDECSLFVTHNIEGPKTRQSEAFGVAFLEALAHGLPVVSTRSGGIPEIVVDGECGLLSDPFDLETQARNVVRLQNDPKLWATMASRARDRAQEKFTFEQEKARLCQILREP